VLYTAKKIKERVTIIIPTYNGLKLLSENLPHLLKAMYFAGGNHEIIVVDDGGTDNTVSFLKSRYPQIRTIKLPKNYGFARACNIASKESKNPILLFLNNDIKVTKDFLIPLIEPFKEEDIFAVSPKIIADRDKFIESIHETTFTSGYFCNRRINWDSIEKINSLFPISFASGAALAVDKDKFFELGGFDEIFHPYYWEDVDLSYRAWKKGWRVIYHPGSVVFHQRGATIGDGSLKPEVDQIFLRNMIIFTWKNLTDMKLLLTHFLILPFDLLFAFIGKRKNYLTAFKMALPRIKEIIKKRKKQNVKFNYTDSEVLSFFKDSVNTLKNKNFSAEAANKEIKIEESNEVKDESLSGKNILVIHTHGGIGDLLLSTPVFSTLKINSPDSHIAVMVDDKRAEVLTGNPYIDEIITIDPERMGTLSYFMETLKMIKEKKFDISIVLWSTAWEAYLTFFAGIETRIGQSGRLLYSMLYNRGVRVLSEYGDKTSHWVEIVLDYVRALDIEKVDRRIFFEVPQKDKDDTHLLFEEFGLNKSKLTIGMHIGKGLSLNSSKWPTDKFASIADKLVENLKALVILTGSSEEVELVNDVERKMKYKAVNLAGQLNLKQLGAVIEKCDLFICPDSGPMHIAAALNVPVIAIFALKSDFPNRWHPYGTKYEIVRNIHINCGEKCVKEKCEKFVCMEQIKEDDVISAADRLLKSGKIF